MKISYRFLNVTMIIVALLPVIYLILLWKQIPQIVPLHFNGNFEPDRKGSKSQLAIVVMSIELIAIVLLFVMSNIKHLDPKRRNAPASSVFNKMAAGIVLFITGINIMFIISSVKGAVVFGNFLFPLMGLLFAFIGNYMNNIKPNYFAGFRLPWTLSDDENWRKTHRLAGHLWFWTGLFITIISLLLPTPIVFPVLLSSIAIISIIPTVYSYKLFKTKQYKS